MASQPVLTFHNGRLEVPEQLQRDWQLREGSELRVVLSSAGQIVLTVEEAAKVDAAAVLEAWESLRGVLPDYRTPEWEAAARARKERAQRELDRLYSSGGSTTELKQAEREWELADDELDFGPFAKP